MNIVYKLTNLDKEEGKRFYIGSKTECFIEKIEGVDVIISIKTGLPYYGSSTCIDMKSDMQAGHRFQAEILEEVPQKKDIIAVENKWIKYFNAVNSTEFYNKNYAIIGKFVVDQHAPYNRYGETIVEYGKRMSSLKKRDNNARRFGFENLGDMCIFFYQKNKEGHSWADIARMIGWERHQPRRYISDYNMEKCIKEVDSIDREQTAVEVRKLLSKGCSIYKISELLSLEIPTIMWSISNLEESMNAQYLCAVRKGLTKEGLEIMITKMVLDGKGFNEVSRELKMNEASVKRYFLRCVRAKLKSSDL